MNPSDDRLQRSLHRLAKAAFANHSAPVGDVLNPCSQAAHLHLLLALAASTPTLDLEGFCF
jgi:hypothetical protein